MVICPIFVTEYCSVSVFSVWGILELLAPQEQTYQTGLSVSDSCRSGCFAMFLSTGVYLELRRYFPQPLRTLSPSAILQVSVSCNLVPVSRKGEGVPGSTPRFGSRRCRPLPCAQYCDFFSSVGPRLQQTVPVVCER